MSEFIGREINMAVGVEAVRGTAQVTAGRTIRKVTCDIIPRADRVIDDTTFGRLEDAERVRTVRKWSEGGLEGILHADVLGYFLLNIYGDVNSGVDAGDAYKHTFSLEQSLAHPTLTLFVKDADVRQEKIAGAVISKFSINSSSDNYVRFKAEFLGKEGTDDTSSLPALSDEYDFVGRDVSVKIADTEEGLAAATALKAKDLSIEWNPNAEADYVLGSYSPDNIYNKQMSIEGEMSLNYVDNTFEDLYKGDDFKFMQITIQGEAEIETGKHPKAVITCHKIQVTDWSRTSAGNDISTQSVKWKAFLNTDESKQSEVELTNLTTEYIAAS